MGEGAGMLSDLGTSYLQKQERNPSQGMWLDSASTPGAKGRVTARVGQRPGQAPAGPVQMAPKPEMPDE